MVLKKSIVSYFLWIIYAVAAVAGLLLFASIICDRAQYSESAGLAVCACVFVAEAAACAIFHALAKHNRIKTKRINLSIFEGVAAVIILAAALAFYIMNMQGGTAQSIYYDAAVVKSGSVISFAGDVTEFLYLKALNFLFFVFGNKITVATVLQIVISFVSLVLIYFAVRRLAGAVSALISLVFMAVSGVFVGMMSNVEPDAFRFLIFSAGLYITAVCFPRKKNLVLKLFLALLAGIYIGFFSGDCAVVATLAITAFGCSICHSAGKISEMIFKIFFTVLGVCGGLAAYFVLYSAYAGAGADKALADWLGTVGILNFSSWQYGLLDIFEYFGQFGYLMFVMQAVICLGIFTFLINKKSYLTGMWLINLMCAAVLAAAGENKIYAICAVYLIMTVLAGIAVQNLFHIDTADTTVCTETQTAANDENGDAENMAEQSTNGTPGRTVTVNVDGEDRQIKLLDNPLTLPKKKEHKMMDYDYEVADDDDFDI
jgi:hypothetical protein